MNARAGEPVHGPAGARLLPPFVRVGLYGAGGLLFAGAIYAAVSGTSDGLRAFSRAFDRPGLLVALVLLPLACLTLASLSFWVLTRRYGRVTPVEMFALLGGAWLLNYLPFKPGVAGRVAYQKSVLGIELKWSLLVVVQSIVIGLVCFGLQVALASIAAGTSMSELQRAAFIALPLAAAVAGLAIPRRGALAHAWRYSAAFGFRYADSLVWALRYHVLFQVAGRPQGVSTSNAIAGISQSASLIPFAGNGLGVREWMVGLAAKSLPEWYGKETAMPVAYGVSAELLNRACEVIVAVPVGLICLWWLARRSGRARSLETPGLAETSRT